MKLSTSIVLLALAALAFAAPDNYGKQLPSKRARPHHAGLTTTTLPPTTTTTMLMTTTKMIASDAPAVYATTTPNYAQAEFDCSGHDDGAYASPDGCAQDYYLCWKGVTTKASCPDNMFFNVDNDGCDFHDNVFVCSGVSTTTLAADQPLTLKPINFDCSNLADGDYPYSAECKATYVSCVGGLGMERTCPDGLLFDPDQHMCERPENIVSCGGIATTVLPDQKIDFQCPQPSGSFALTSQLCSAIYYSCNDNIASIAVCDSPMIWNDANKQCALPKDVPDCSYDCSGKADGAYSEGCSQTYWWCWQAVATKVSCPDGMFFDAASSQCLFHDDVFECTGVSTTTLAADQPSTLKPVDFDCSGLEDGPHAFLNGEKCQPKFVSCVGGVAWEMDCPSGLLFDPDQLLCEHIENIVACGGTPKPPTTLASDSGVSSSNYGYGYQTTALPADIPKKDIPKKSYGNDIPKKHSGLKKLLKKTQVAHKNVHPQKFQTTQAYGGYNNIAQDTTISSTTILTTTMPTTVMPTKKHRPHKIRTTTVEDIPLTTTLAYDSDDYGSSIQLDLTTPPAPRHAPRKHPITSTTLMPTTTTLLSDEPITDSYGNILTTQIFDVPTSKSYGYGQKLTTIADIPITTTKASYGYGQKLTTTLADIPIPTTKSYGYGQKLTTIADTPITKAYSQRTTTLLDIPITTTTQSYGYGQRTIPTTTLLDLPMTDSYGNILSDTPAPRHAPRKQRPTTTTMSTTLLTTTPLSDEAMTDSYGNILTTTPLMDEPMTDSYGNLILSDEPITTTTRRVNKVAFKPNKFVPHKQVAKPIKLDKPIKLTKPVKDQPINGGY